jgi:hypothetical protein
MLFLEVAPIVIHVDSCGMGIPRHTGPNQSLDDGRKFRPARAFEWKGAQKIADELGEVRPVHSAVLLRVLDRLGIEVKVLGDLSHRLVASAQTCI